MCFSAKASFAAAGALSIIGFASLKQVRRKKIIPFAITPLFFALQQASEGFVWITLNNGDTTRMFHMMSVYSFLFFAAMFWPTWVPFSLYIAEEVNAKKRRLFIVLCCGIIVSLFFLYYWILPITHAVVINHHISYPITDYPFGITNKMCGEIVSHFLCFLYGATTVIPFFISSIPSIKLLGFTLAIGGLIAYIFYLVAFPSVWCFFAALCSILIYGIVHSYEKKVKL